VVNQALVHTLSSSGGQINADALQKEAESGQLSEEQLNEKIQSYLQEHASENLDINNV
jgi:hypothetical protein